ncbi:MAG TPA: acyl-CoA thioesterase [Chakrabartia sp.]|nr:acyl-CoA thioesterase [Chakrabartia sp.]
MIETVMNTLPNTYRTTITPAPEDFDELGHVNNAVWVRWIQDVATAHWMAVATPDQTATYVWVVTRHEIDYAANVGPGQAVHARTWISDAPKGARYDRNMEFTDEAGRILVKSITTWALIDRTKGRIVRVPAEIPARFGVA